MENTPIQSGAGSPASNGSAPEGEVEKLGAEIATLKYKLACAVFERDALLDMTWLDLPGEPEECTAKWRAEFEKGWMRRAEAQNENKISYWRRLARWLLRSQRDSRSQLAASHGSASLVAGMMERVATAYGDPSARLKWNARPSSDNQERATPKSEATQPALRCRSSLAGREECSSPQSCPVRLKPDQSRRQSLGAAIRNTSLWLKGLGSGLIWKMRERPHPHLRGEKARSVPARPVARTRLEDAMATRRYSAGRCNSASVEVAGAGSAKSLQDFYLGLRVHKEGGQ